MKHNAFIDFLELSCEIFDLSVIVITYVVLTSIIKIFRPLNQTRL